ncbi:MAG: hypothetical protein JJD93_16800 [Ilumatobacteraceae bacterium]|nr:hypothetical protein [Ilumatobacteraceae bacterium]
MIAADGTYWAPLVISAVLAAALAVAGAYFVGRYREKGRSDEADARQAKADQAAEDAKQMITAAERVAVETARQSELRRVEEIANSRVGKVFLRHYSNNDAGVRVVVLALSTDDPDHKVLLEYPPNDANPDGLRVKTEWRAMTEPDDVQRHRTARTIAQSYDDSEGWVEWELLPE